MYKSVVFGDEFLAQGLHLQSHQRYGHVRIEKGPVQTVAIIQVHLNKLECREKVFL